MLFVSNKVVKDCFYLDFFDDFELICFNGLNINLLGLTSFDTDYNLKYCFFLRLRDGDETLGVWGPDISRPILDINYINDNNNNKTL